MPTDELEHELRRAIASAAAEYQHPEQARQRLLQRNYRPGSGRRRLTAGMTAAAAAGSVALGLSLSGGLGSSPLHGTGTIRTAAFTITRNANGSAALVPCSWQMTGTGRSLPFAALQLAPVALWHPGNTSDRLYPSRLGWEEPTKIWSATALHRHLRRHPQQAATSSSQG